MPLKTTNGVQFQPPIITIYGPQGVGKNTWAAGAPKPVFLRTEDGMGLLSADRMDLCKDFDTVMNQLRDLYTEQHDFKTLVIDSADHLDPLITQSILKKHSKADLADFGWNNGPMMVAETWRKVLDAVKYIREVKQMAVIFTAHCSLHEANDPTSESYKKFGIKLPKLAGQLLYETSDCVFFADYEKHTVTDERTKKVRAVGEGNRKIFTEERPTFQAKNRWKLPPVLDFPATGAWNIFAAELQKSFAAESAPPVPSSTPPAAAPAAAQASA